MLQQQLSRQFNDNKLPHALLINGATGSGKLSLAQWLISLLLCQKPVPGSNQILNACGCCKSCLLLNSDSYPDHFFLQSQSTSLGVDDIRKANTFLEKTAHIGKFKTVLVNDAQTMTVAAANALLKTLEEPTDNSIIILITNDIGMLLPTIISRCHVLTIRPLSGDTLVKKLSATSIMQAEEDNGFLNLSHLPELSEKIVADEYKKFNQYYLNYLENGQYEDDLLKKLLESKHALRWLEKITCNLTREYYLSGNTISDQFKAKLTPQMLNELYKVIINSSKVIKSFTQANDQFVLEQLLMTIDKIVQNKE